ncbi:hypothetical protein [Kordia sp.]|uniref:hypothetical protein n=1 Tax=Kordia sp. TaxID=1965332 RepID=UPI003B5BC60B
MTFPAINIALKKWNIEDLEDYAFEFTLYDDYIHHKDESYFIEYFKNGLFCDAEGKLFKMVAKAEMTQKWRNWLQFIPGVWKTKVIFKDTYQKISVEELRTYLLARLSELGNEKLF